MLLFWTLNEEEYEAAIEDEEENILTKPEQIVNYLVGAFLIVCFLVSVTLNPVLFYYHHTSNKQGVTTFLYSGLAVSDFLTNLIGPLVYTVFLVRPNVYNMNDTTILTSFGIMSCTTGCFSQCSTTLLAITRFLKIFRPFVRIRKRILIAYLTIYTLIMFVNNLTLVMPKITKSVADDDFDYWIFVKICYFLNTVHCILALTFSMITVIYVYFFKAASQTDDVTKKACTTILLMNIVYIISLLCAVVPVLALLEVLQEPDSFFSLTIMFYCISFFIMPVLSSAWNPIILFVKLRAVRQTCISLISSLPPGMVRNKRISCPSVGNFDHEQQSEQSIVRRKRANSNSVETTAV